MSFNCMTLLIDLITCSLDWECVSFVHLILHSVFRTRYLRHFTFRVKFTLSIHILGSSQIVLVDWRLNIAVIRNTRTFSWDLYFVHPCWVSRWGHFLNANTYIQIWANLLKFKLPVPRAENHIDLFCIPEEGRINLHFQPFILLNLGSALLFLNFNVPKLILRNLDFYIVRFLDFLHRLSLLIVHAMTHFVPNFNKLRRIVSFLLKVHAITIFGNSLLIANAMTLFLAFLLLLNLDWLLLNLILLNRFLPLFLFLYLYHFHLIGDLFLWRVLVCIIFVWRSGRSVNLNEWTIFIYLVIFYW